MVKKRIKRDAGIELVRLLACLIVIACHTAAASQVNGEFIFSRVYLSCLFADGVGMFWLISGCFLFSSTYGKTLKNAFFRVLIPLILISLFGYWLSMSQAPGFQPTPNSDLLYGLSHWGNGVWGMEHLWYLYTYFILLLAWPILKRIADWMDSEPWHGYVLVLAVLVLFLCNDLLSNRLFFFSHWWPHAIWPAAAEMLVGHWMYRQRAFFRPAWKAIVFLLLFFGLNWLRAIWQMHNYGLDEGNTWILYWFSCLGLMAAMSLMAAGMSLFKLPAKTDVPGLGSTILVSLASYTFVIYLIHFPIIRILNGTGIAAKIHDFFFAGGTSFAREIGCSLVMSAIVFVISLAASALIRLFWTGIKKLANLFHFKTV